MRPRRFFVVLALVIGAVAPAGARDRHNHDAEFARGELQRGEVLPIERVLSLASGHLPGDIIGVRLEPNRSGALFYEIKILTPSGQIRDLVLNARTGEFVKVEN